MNEAEAAAVPQAAEEEEGQTVNDEVTEFGPVAVPAGFWIMSSSNPCAGEPVLVQPAPVPPAQGHIEALLGWSAGPVPPPPIETPPPTPPPPPPKSVYADFLCMLQD